jgi:hypothetical protein
VDAELERCLGVMNDPVRAALVECLVARRAPGVKGVLLEQARAKGVMVRRAALRGLATLAKPSDLPALLGLMNELEAKGDRQELAKVIEAVCAKVEDRDAVLHHLVAALEGRTPAVRAALLRVLGALPSEVGLPPLLAGVTDESEEVRLAAVEALAEWPDTKPLETLAGIARDASAEPRARVVALTGYLRLVASSELSSAEKAQAFQQAFASASSDAEKKAAVDCAMRVGQGWTIGVLEGFGQDPAVAAEVAASLEAVRAKVARRVPHAAVGKAPTLAELPAEQYAAGGPAALTDGTWGSIEHTDGKWHGFEGKDLYAVIDLGQPTQIKSVRIGYLERPNSWILPPARLEVELSDDGMEWSSTGTDLAPLPEMTPEALRSRAFLFTGQKARYVRVVARSPGLLPAWHPGSGEKAWMFVDEIAVNPDYGAE